MYSVIIYFIIKYYYGGVLWDEIQIHIMVPHSLLCHLTCIIHIVTTLHREPNKCLVQTDMECYKRFVTKKTYQYTKY